MNEIVKRIQPNKETLIRLFAKSGNQCAFEDCTNFLFDDQGVFLAEVCHIEAALEGGERFNKDMTNIQRAQEDNLIALCHAHHKITDNVDEYSVNKLKEIKRRHESKFVNSGTFKINDVNIQSIYDKQYEILHDKLFDIQNQLNQIRTLDTFIHYLNKSKSKLNPSKYLFENQLIYFTPDELKRLNDIKNTILKGTINTFIITGYPSSGKTTFSLQLGQELLNELKSIYYFQFNSEHKLIDIKDDIIRLKNHNTVIFFDDIHKNLPLANEIYNFLEEYHNIFSIFISRDLSKDLQEGETLNIFEEIKNHYSIPRLNSKSIQDKFIGIIDAFKNYTGINQKIGDINKIVSFCNANYIKLFLYLEFWNEIENRSVLSEISKNDFNRFLKKKYIPFLNLIDESMLIECSSVYSFGIDFHFLGDVNTRSTLEINGIINEINNTKLYEFWHTKFAELILLCILSGKSTIDNSSIEDKIETIIEQHLLNYLQRFPMDSIGSFQYPKNLLLIIASLSQRRNRQLIIKLLDNQHILELLLSFLDNEKIDPLQIKELIKHLRYNAPNHLIIVIDKYITKNNFIESLETHNHGFEILIYLLFTCYKLNLSKHASKITSILSDNALKNIVAKATVREITLSTILLKNYFPAFPKKVLNSLDINDWKIKFSKLPAFIISNALTEIKRVDSILSSKILESFEKSILLSMSLDLNFGYFEKFLGEIKEINIEIAHYIYSELDDFCIISKLENAAIAQIGKGFIVLNLLNDKKTNRIYNSLDNNMIVAKLLDVDVKNSFRIIAELYKIDKTKTYEILTILLSKGITKKINDVTDLYTLINNIILIKYPEPSTYINTLPLEKIKQILLSGSIDNYASALLAINKIDNILANQLFDETFIIQSFNKISLTALGPLMHRLILVNENMNLYCKIPKTILINKSLANDIKFSQVMKSFDELSSIDMNYTLLIVNELFSIPKFLNKSYRENIDSFLNSIDSLNKINPSLAISVYNNYRDKHKNNIYHQSINFLIFCSGINKLSKFWTDPLKL